MIVSFVQINLYFYYYENSSFEITNSYLSLVFEFLYYSFNVIITYSNSNIIAVGVIPKLLQMIYVSFVYFFIGQAIYDIISKTYNVDNK